MNQNFVSKILANKVNVFLIVDFTLDTVYKFLGSFIPNHDQYNIYTSPSRLSFSKWFMNTNEKSTNPKNLYFLNVNFIYNEIKHN